MVTVIAEESAKRASFPWAEVFGIVAAPAVALAGVPVAFTVVIKARGSEADNFVSSSLIANTASA